MMTLIFLCLLSAGNTQTSCNKLCVLGNPIFDADKNCRCKCVLKITGEICGTLPNCGSKSCGTFGSLRGDCECICNRIYTGELCQTYRCPYSDHPECGRGEFSTCNTVKIQQECPYQCGLCKESQRPKIESGKYVHISQYGCIFQGIRPSKEMCRTLGNNGDDKMSCFDESDADKNCRLCNNGDRHALLNCPVMCALCEKPVTDNTTTTPSVTSTTTASLTSTTTANVTSTITAGSVIKTTAIVRNTTHVPQIRQTQTANTLNSGKLAGVVVGVVLGVVLVSIVIVVLARRYSCTVSKKNPARQSTDDVTSHYDEIKEGVHRNEHYVTANNVENETNSKYEMISNETSINRSYRRKHEYDDGVGVDQEYVTFENGSQYEGDNPD